MVQVKTKIAAGFAASVLASTGYAADAAFENHLTSTSMVSPAQLYQTRDLKTDFSLGYRSASGALKPTAGDKTDLSGSTTDIFAGAIYNVQNVGLRAGLTVGVQNADTQSETTVAGATTKTKGDESNLTVSPTAAYQAGPVVVGAAVEIVQATEKYDGGEEMRRTYNRVRPGVLFADDKIEAGLVYVSPNNVTEDTEKKELAVQEAAQVTVHGRYAVAERMAVGAIVTNVNYKGLNEDAWKDQQRVRGTFEMGNGPVKVEGDLGYNTAYHKNKEGMDFTTISTVALGAAADYAVNPKTAFGAGLGYEFGSDKNEAAKYEKNLLTVAVRGNMKF